MLEHLVRGMSAEAMRSRRGRRILGFVLLGCAAVIVWGRDTAAYLIHRHRLRDDPEGMCELLFERKDTPKVRAAREQLRAHAWEAGFSRVVAEKSWRSLEVREDGYTFDRRLRAAPEGEHYRVWKYLRRGAGRFSEDFQTKELTSIARVWGPFLIDAGDSGAVSTWGLVDGKLVLGALVRIARRDWVLFHSGTSFQGENHHVFLRLSFDRDLEPGAQGLCRHLKTESQAPLISFADPKVDFAGGRDVYYMAAEEPALGPGRVVIVAMNPQFRLHLDTNLGIGWHEYWSSFVYEEDRETAARP